MKIEVKGQIFPKVWNIAKSVKRLRTEIRKINLGGGTMTVPVYEVELPEGTVEEGKYLVTPQGVRLYHNRSSEYDAGYILSEIDKDPMVSKHFS